MAQGFIKRLTKSIFLLPMIILCGTFLLASLSPYLNPYKWWPIGFLSLLQPYLIVFLVFAVIFWLAVKPVYTLIPLLSLALGWNQISVIFAANPLSSFDIQKRDSTIRLVSWNVGSMYGLSDDANIRKHSRTEIAAAILHLEPDIICLQEFNNSLTQGPQADNIGLFRNKYPYFYFSKDYDKRNGFYQSGSIIFSKYPIIDSGKILYPHPLTESFIYADIVKQSDTFRVYTVHLQSFKFVGEDYENIERIKNNEATPEQSRKTIFRKMKTAFTRRGIQASCVRDSSDQSPYPSIICGDFNDVPGSYVYFHIRGRRKDAFLEKGFGVGRSYSSLAPTLRIDYILPDEAFGVRQFDMVDEDLSDHIMLVSDLSIKK